MKQLNPQISWKIKGTYKSYNPTSKRCNLCLTEKLEILDDSDLNIDHRLKTLASNMTSGDVSSKDAFNCNDFEE